MLHTSCTIRVQDSGSCCTPPHRLTDLTLRIAGIVCRLVAFPTPLVRLVLGVFHDATGDWGQVLIYAETMLYPYLQEQQVTAAGMTAVIRTSRLDSFACLVLMGGWALLLPILFVSF